MDLILLGQRLKELRKSAKMSQETLAEKAGISHKAYSDIELAKTKPHNTTILALCKALGVSPYDLKLGELTYSLPDSYIEEPATEYNVGRKTYDEILIENEQLKAKMTRFAQHIQSLENDLRRLKLEVTL